MIDRHRPKKIGIGREKPISPYSPEELKRIDKETREKRRSAFRSLGIRNNKALRYFVEAPGITPESLAQKLNDFKKAGFRDPLNLFNKFPVIYNFEPKRIIAFLQREFNKYLSSFLKERKLLTEAEIIEIIERFPGYASGHNLSEKQIEEALTFLAKKSKETNISRDEN